MGSIGAPLDSITSRPDEFEDEHENDGDIPMEDLSRSVHLDEEIMEEPRTSVEHA